MANATSKERVYLEVTDDMKFYGLGNAYVFGDDIYLEFEGDKLVVSGLKRNWASTVDVLRERLAAKEGMDDRVVDTLLILLTKSYSRSSLAGNANQDSENIGHNIDPETVRIIQEINSKRQSIGDIPLYVWEDERLKKYEKLKSDLARIMPSLWLPLEFILSAKSILHIKDITLPFAGIVLGVPASNKTLSLSLLKAYPNTFYTDSFTAKSIVSHSSAKRKSEELEKIDMLPRMKNKAVLVPELSPMFMSREEVLMELLGILTRVLDGHGYQSESGVHGHRGYKGKHMFVLLGAAVEIPYNVYKVLGYLGPKLYFFRIPREKPTEEEIVKAGREVFDEKFKLIQKSLFDLLVWLEIRPDMVLIEEEHTKNKTGSGYENNYLPLAKVEWDFSKDDNNAESWLFKLAELLSHMRGVVRTWESGKMFYNETEDDQNTTNNDINNNRLEDYAYNQPIIENPSRAFAELKNLAKGRAFINGRNYISLDDVPVAVKTVLSTAPPERVSLIEKFILRKELDKETKLYLTTTQIVASLNISKPTARRAMQELTVLGLTTIDKSKKEWSIRLNEKFYWLIEDGFRELVGDYRATSYEPEG